MVNFHDPKVIQSDAGTFSLFSLGLCASSSQDELKLLLGTFRLSWLAFFCTSQNVLQVCQSNIIQCRWEFVTTVDFEWKYVTEKRKFKWPLLVRLVVLILRRATVADVMWLKGILGLSHLHPGFYNLWPHKHRCYPRNQLPGMIYT